MEILDRAGGATLEEVVMGTSPEGATVNTDDWDGYNGLAHMPWDHARVSHSGPKSTWARDDDGDGSARCTATRWKAYGRG